MNPLRVNSATLGREMPSLLANGIILAERRAQFLRIWLQTYKTYDSRSWSGHSTHIPHRLNHENKHIYSINTLNDYDDFSKINHF